MHSFQSLAITALVALPALVTADIISGDINGNQCPSDWSNIQYKDIRRCCYGSLTVESNDPYCCVHSFSLSNNNNIGDVKSDCFPFCTVTRGSLPTMTYGSGASCETKIAFTTDDYSSLVSAASASATGTKASDSDATTTTSGETETETGKATSTGKDSGETSTNMAGPIATAESFAIGGAAVAAAFFAL